MTKVSVLYRDLTPDQKLQALWMTFCDADPVPIEFIDEMEAAGLVALVPVTEDALDEAFAYERGLEAGGMMWQLTDAGRAALSRPK